MHEFVAVTHRQPLRLEPALAARHKQITYQPTSGLAEAADAAMLLGVPLLLTGEPGSGKTSAATWLAKSLGVSAPLEHPVKSTTTGRDLLYSFDEIGQFRDSNRAETTALIEYLQFNALGAAILRAAGGRAILQTADGRPLEGEWFRTNRKLVARAFGPDATRGTAAYAALLLPHETDFADAAPEHRVVLVDEFDKAPRDTPNDLLTEIDNMAFVIPELGLRLAAPPGMRPVIVITSNSEKSLPEPFLRRCAYFNIPVPDDTELRSILDAAIPAVSGSTLVGSALTLFHALRLHPRVQKKPGTAELLALLDVLHRTACPPDMSLGALMRAYQNPGTQDVDPFEDRPAPTVRRGWPPLGVLMKSDDDIAIAMDLLAP